jgi:hypothetical protein
VLNLHLRRLQLRSQLQPNMRHFLAHRGEHSRAVLLELAAKCVEIRLIDLVARPFRAARIMRITALARLPRPQIRERLRV